MDDSRMKSTCRDCSSHELEVIHEFTEIANCTAPLV
jgi:hypothetical protein